MTNISSLNFIDRSRSFWPTRPLILASSTSSALSRELSFCCIDTVVQNFTASNILIKCFNKVMLLLLCSSADASETVLGQTNRWFLFINTLMSPQLQETSTPAARSWRGGTSPQRRVHRVMSQRGRREWRNSGISRKGGEGERERKRKLSDKFLCIFLWSYTNFTNRRNDWRPRGDQRAEERDLNGRTDISLSAVVHSWWQHQILTLFKALGLEWL